MGDGGVACMPLQQHQHIMERFPVTEKMLCPNNGLTSKPVKLEDNAQQQPQPRPRKKKKMVKVKKVVVVKKKVVARAVAAVTAKAQKSELVVKAKSEAGLKSSKEVDKCENSGQKEEVEEGELGTLKWPREGQNGEVGIEKSMSLEIEKGEIASEKWRKEEVEKEKIVSEGKRIVEKAETVPGKKGEVEKGETFSGKKGELVNGEIVMGKWRKGEAGKRDMVLEKGKKGEAEKREFGSWRGAKDDLDKGEFVPDRWHKGEVIKDEYSYSKSRKYELGKEKSCKNEMERTTPSGKYSVDDLYRRKEFSRSGTQHSKSSSRWETGHERTSRISSKIVDEEGWYKSEYSNGKNHGRDYPSSNRLKRHGTDSDSTERKHYGDYGDYANSKSRRLSDDFGRSSNPELYSHHSVERFYRNSSSSRMSSLDKYCSRRHESSLSSRVVYDRHGRSPGYSERSPRDRIRNYDHRDQSPIQRERSPCARDRSPYTFEKSPERSPYARDRSLYAWERSPFDQSRRYDHRNRSPINAEWSPQDRARFHDRRDRTPSYLELSPHDRNKPNNHRDTSRKGAVNEKRNSQYGSKGQEGKVSQRDLSGRDSLSSVKESQDRTSVGNMNGSDEKNAVCEFHKEDQSLSPSVNCQEHPLPVDEASPEELKSMEEDMDICDTPPHIPVVAEAAVGKWIYLDYFGVERGPSKLCDLKALVEERVLLSDHLIKHSDSDRWVTVENAASPILIASFPSIVSDTVTQLVSPPEAPGNLLVEIGDPRPLGTHSGDETVMSYRDDSAAASESLEDLHIDERVRALLDGINIIPGKELEIVGEVLQMTFDDVQWEGWGNSEGFTWFLSRIGDQHDKITDKISSYSESNSKEAAEFRVGAHSDVSSCADSSDWFSGQWLCKGGDWKRNDEATQERSSRKKLVLNDGYPLCHMPKSGYEDPRWPMKDDLYHPSHSRKLDLPSWAFSNTEERSDCNDISRSNQIKPSVARGVKGTMLPVIRINACVVQDQGSFVFAPRTKVRGKERHSSRSAWSHSTTSDIKKSSVECDSLSKAVNDQGLKGSWKFIAPVSTPKDHVCTVDELQLHLGEWYYFDGAGHERGPSSFSELQVLVDQGAIQKHSSVYHKYDQVWVPVTSAAGGFEATAWNRLENVGPAADSSGPLLLDLQDAAISDNNTRSCSFHSLHPQFIGYTRGKLHELVMKSFKSREFAAAINEVLDPWISVKQPKKEMDKNIFQKTVDNGKRARMMINGREEEYDIEDELQSTRKDEPAFEDLCGDAAFHEQEGVCSVTEMGNWGLLDGHVLARVFHFLRSDMKSLAFGSLTCKHWRAAVRFYKGIGRQVDLSSLGPKCSDSVLRNIMNGYNKEKMNSMILIGCTNIIPSTLEDVLHLFPSLWYIDIRGCSQFGELTVKFPNLRWFKSRSLHAMTITDESNSKVRSLKQITEKTSSGLKTGSGSAIDDFGELKSYFESVDKRDSANQLFCQSLYRRSKLFDARKSSSILSREARIRRWAIKKSENGYKRMEEFLTSSLRDIMKENTFDFFVPKVADIEERMKNGYYVGHGLGSVKEDISRMCRDAIKAKNRGSARDMNRIITLFIQLATHLEEGAKITSSYERDELLKSWKDYSPTGFSKYKKKVGKAVNERKYMNKSNGTSFANGDVGYGEYASDREIRKRLSKLNRKSLDSESETSDELDPSSEDGKNESEIESTASDTESDLDFKPEGQSGDSRGDGSFMAGDSFDSMADDREWGARMTKASLVPPVTRKYEVIEQYVVVADEEEVRRKMQVSLPEDYAEKLNAQKTGTEELDMELPEVKDYKPRKVLGDEVIEQEVYGIDPYTHNLLLDSMPEELEWPLEDRQSFIEDILLQTLNKQVRQFTGTGNTPMMYPLQPVVEEIKRVAEVDCDIRTMKMCQGILKAIDARPDENYVAYRKGLGVLCNKVGGFGEQDFVVEFLGEVYPVWKWFEKQDGIRLLQKNSDDPAPEFYNINLERPKGDAAGYDLVVVDAMHKANYASRICHSCHPNCEAKVTAVDGQYQIGIYALRAIRYGEEITFDYNSITESKEEYEASVCLCGSQVCRGTYLNLTGEGVFQKVLKEWHGMLNRQQLMLEACKLNSVCEEDYLELGRAGLGSCLLGGLPDWLVAYSARVVRFINFERTKLPEEILRHNLEEKRKYCIDVSLDAERNDAEIQAEGVYNQRLQNLAITLDKVRYVMRCVFGDPKKAPPPIERLSPEEAVSFLWKGEGSLVEELLQCMAPHVEDDMLNNLKSKIRAHDPLGSDNILKELQKSLLWLRDEVRNLPCTYKCRHDAAADLIHIYAYTKCFLRVREYKAVTSPPVYISPLDLGPKHADKFTGLQEYCKTYGENYCLGQLIFWYSQTSVEPDCSLVRASRGCLSLPEIGCFYAKVHKPLRHRVYGPKTLKFMLSWMEKQPQRPWPKDRIWSFKTTPKVFGSPMLDAVLNNSSPDRDMVHWLKHRPAIFQAMWDR
ncbi:histone-lysine N-methyltransferase ATXR3-like isoform X2 [Durio zibethinus]|uniref:Histone-lysine N-methyltransferase ATXR3-like isoform X2 n=1 Tax=Durio zibethinus TaxID=66656 RepID=A0A6P5YR57_DURZI|nr:histone-lysine N-methyltransferase ATXR3-like isoform X2 [Durio zibethinus]